LYRSNYQVIVDR